MQRTRRNLSDPAIKKIVKKQRDTKQTAEGAAHRTNTSSKGPRPLLIIVMILLCIAATYMVLDNTTAGSAVQGWWESLAINMAADSDSASDSTIADSGEGVDSPTLNASIGGREESEAPPPPDRRIQVEVLNGCGVTGLAEKLTNYLRGQDIDVVSVDNYRNFDVGSSFILARTEEQEHSERVATVLGIDADNISSDISQSLQLDATIVIGADYRDLLAFKR